MFTPWGYNWVGQEDSQIAITCEYKTVVSDPTTGVMHKLLPREFLLKC